MDNKENVEFMLELRTFIEENSEELGFKILYGYRDHGYFAVEDKDGYRAYAQIATYNEGVDISILYKPSHGRGSGTNYIIGLNFDRDLVISKLRGALIKARGYEKDNRQPISSNAHYI